MSESDCFCVEGRVLGLSDGLLPRVLQSDVHLT